MNTYICPRNIAKRIFLYIYKTLAPGIYVYTNTSTALFLFCSLIDPFTTHLNSQEVLPSAFELTSRGYRFLLISPPVGDFICVAFQLLVDCYQMDVTNSRFSIIRKNQRLCTKTSLQVCEFGGKIPHDIDFGRHVEYSTHEQRIADVWVSSAFA